MHTTKIFTFLLLIIPLSFFGQSSQYSDQSTAFRICEFGQYSFENLEGMGLEYDEIHSSIDLGEFKETNSIWLRIDVSKSGSLAFIIEPNNPSDDIDFMVLEESDLTLKNVRSNLSGRSYGADHASDNCFNLMGLDELSSDMYEFQGCSEADDNFLKAVKIHSGKTYYILVNNLASKDGFSINIQTDQAEIASSIECIDSPSISETVALYPNPAQKEMTLSFNGSRYQFNSYSITDLSGKLIVEKNIPSETNSININISALLPQSYILSLYTDNEAQHYTFIKI